jgi:hypothetical protein
MDISARAFRLLLISRISFVRAKGPFLRPGPQNVDRVARRGGQGRSSRWACGWLRSCQAAPWPRRARREDPADRTPASSVLVSSKAPSTAQAMRASLLASAIASTLWCNPPLGGFDPGFEPVTFPVLDPDQHNPCGLHEQNAQVAIAAPGDFAEDRAVSRRDLLGHQSKPGAEVAAFGEYVSSADRGATMALEMIGPMPGTAALPV